MQQGKDSEQIAQRYAEALKELALSETGLLEQFGNDTDGILQVMEEFPDFERFLVVPVIAMVDKKRLLVEAFGGKVHPYMLNFLQLMVDRRRIALLRPVCASYQRILRELQQTTLAEVISAVPLSEEQASALIERIRRRTAAVRVELRRRVDPELLGGMIIKIGDEVIDASLRGQLRKLTLQLTLS
ncbi:MAG: F0F1 ATP synthase subunit delta [Aphanocapsa lilacina HA4352-LM1]|jgi:F-type H+-transporting ATPase subunit delta|nr:F0F1 ATP synthase subunit delta [Aphanocapsa lilacina HA4352-LM1]